MKQDFPDSRPTANGFTLVELLVALFVFSLISAAGVALLRSSSDSQLILKERLGERASISRFSNLLEGDLAQAVRRPVRDSSGLDVAAFTDGNGNDGVLFAFTRSGLGIGDEGRSSIGRVQYGFANGNLTRRDTLADGADEKESAVLISGLSDATVRFRDLGGNWRDDWSADDPEALPRAVELVLTPQNAPTYRFVMLVGPQLRPLPLPEAVEGGAENDAF